MWLLMLPCAVQDIYCTPLSWADFSLMRTGECMQLVKMPGSGQGGSAADLLILVYLPMKHINTIASPEGFISSLVHACVLLLPSVEGARQKLVCRHAWLTPVATRQHDAADIQLPCHTCLQWAGR